MLVFYKFKKKLTENQSMLLFYQDYLKTETLNIYQYEHPKGGKD